MNANISAFVIGVEVIIDLLLYNLYECTFKISQTQNPMVSFSLIKLKYKSRSFVFITFA